jgi:hypothetical protein
MLDYVRQFLDARRVSVPLVAVRTPDPASTLRTFIGALNGDAETDPILQWDVLRGLLGVNQPGIEQSRAIHGPNGKPAMVSNKPTAALAMCEAFGVEDSNTLVFFHNAHLFWSDPVVKQGIWNLRDRLKGGGSMLILLCSMGATLPEELSDVYMIDEPLPVAADIEAITRAILEGQKQPEPSTDLLGRAVDATVGLSMFSVEQTIAMSTTKAKGLDTNAAWERKRSIIEQTKGMSVWRKGERFADIGGCENSKTFNQRLIDARAFRVVLFMDEIEKMFAGTGTDTSGVITQLTGTFLSWMQDTGALGELFIGHPGAAKSAMAKAIGNEAGVPTVAFDVGAMQNSLVGQSGDNLRTALKRVDAIGQGKVLVIGTCNKIDSLPPELRRRFKLSTFFFDLPTEAGRAKIWDIYRAKCQTQGALPDDSDWTGAEIRTCAEQSELLKISLEEAATYIVPVAVADPERIEALRRLASGRFISAEAAGTYQFTEQPTVTPRARKMRADLDADVMTRKGNA